jgi:hypothetical protein
MKGQEAFVKGSGLRTAMHWFAKRFGKEAFDEFVGALPVEHRTMVTALLPSSWYPIALMENTNRLFPKIAGCTDRSSHERFYREMTGHVAEENLTSFYKALLYLMNPDRMFDLVPRIFLTYFKGIEVGVERVAANQGTCTVHGLGRVPYLALNSLGWLEFAYRKVGGNLKITERNWDRGSEFGNPLVLQLDWS